MATSSTKLLAAAIVGVAAGIGIGLLIAPAKGSKTRKRIKKKILEMADYVEEELNEKIHDLKSGIEGLTDGKAEK
ncbi:MAG: YtxH domain-containing protein [bacterium]